MKMIIMFDMDNAAFSEGQDGDEVTRVLDTVARQFRRGERGRAVMDSNGNTCGAWEVEEYVELTPDEVLSVKDRLSRSGRSTAQALICGNDERRGYDDRKVRVLAEVRS